MYAWYTLRGVRHAIEITSPQLVCYSWMAGIPNVALVVFVRKHQPVIQYLRTSISEEQRLEFARLIATTIGQIETAQFPAHSGIRFPQNGCVSCSHIGLGLDDQKLTDSSLIRTAGGNDLAWLDELGLTEGHPCLHLELYLSLAGSTRFSPGRKFII